MSNSDLPLSPFIESWKTVNKYNVNMNNSELFDNLLFNLHHADNIHDGMTSEAFKGGLPLSFQTKDYYNTAPLNEDQILINNFGEKPSSNDNDDDDYDFWKNQINHLLGKEEEDLIAYKDDLSKFEVVKTDLLGEQYKLRGQVKKNDMFERIEFSVQFVEKASPEEETNKLEQK